MLRYMTLTEIKKGPMRSGGTQAMTLTISNSAILGKISKKFLTKS